MDRTEEVPSRLSIVVGMVGTAGAMISTFWIGTGLWSMREVVGFGLGVVAVLLLLVETLGRIYRRGSAGVDQALADAELDEIRARWQQNTAQAFEPFRPASPMVRGPSGSYPAPDVTARIYRDDSTQILNGFRHEWHEPGPGSMRRTD